VISLESTSTEHPAHVQNGAALDPHVSQKLSLLPKVIDLFAGVGGLSLGAARAGFHVVLSVEKDKHALASHKKNFPYSLHSGTDISTLDGESLLEIANLKNGELDGLIGGPPCQGFSSIGHRNVEDSRNTLFAKFFCLVAESRPKFFVAENVLGILSPQYDSIRESALKCVGDGYKMLAPFRVKASDYGAPTVRERVFFVGIRDDCSNHDIDIRISAPPTNIKAVTVKEALKGLPRIRSTWIEEHQGWRKLTSTPEGEFGEYSKHRIPLGVGDLSGITSYKNDSLVSGCLGTEHSDEVKMRYGNLKPGERDSVSRSVRLVADGFCPTLRAGTGPERGSYQAVRPIHHNSPRVITPREAARLQGFPDWFQFAPSKWHSFRQIGNSVSPIVSEAILSRAKDLITIST